MPASVREFYDRFADDYHLIYEDWHHEVRRQGAVLDRLLRSYLGAGSLRVLDCACGIGTQAIGLARRGHQVTATDVSERSVERARDEAKAFGVEVDFGVADFRDLSEVSGTFDVVLACDNALPHLITDAELGEAAASMRARVRPGGLLVASIRDYDAALASRPRATQPRVFDTPDGARVYMQIWDWSEDGRTTTVQVLLLQEGDAQWSVTHHSTTYRALPRGELTGLLMGAGFSQVKWHLPDESGFFQPIVTARA